MAENKTPFRAGDIVRNNWTTEKNPCHYLLYLRKGTIRQGRYTSKSYDCIDYQGRKHQQFQEDSKLEVVGHMDEYDAFIAALKALEGAKVGKWIEYFGSADIHCPVCGLYHFMDEKDELPSRCPKCGAYMMGREVRL